MRKLFDNESPLGLLLRWTLDEPGLGAAITGRSCDKPMTGGGGGGGCQLDVLRERFNSTLAVKRIVLQENETDDIEVRFFSFSPSVCWRICFQSNGPQTRWSVDGRHAPRATLVP